MVLDLQTVIYYVINLKSVGEIFLFLSYLTHSNLQI